MAKVKVTVVIEVNKSSKAAKEWKDVDQYVDAEVKDALMNVRGDYNEWQQYGEGKLSTGTKYKFETD